MDFGEFVKKNREAGSMSTKYLAEIVGCTPSFIRGIERGAQTPSTTMARSILKAIGIRFLQLDPVTLELLDGQVFKFKASVPGQNRQPRHMKHSVFVISIVNNGQGVIVTATNGGPEGPPYVRFKLPNDAEQVERCHIGKRYNLTVEEA